MVEFYIRELQPQVQHETKIYSNLVDFVAELCAKVLMQRFVAFNLVDRHNSGTLNQ